LVDAVATGEEVEAELRKQAPTLRLISLSSEPARASDGLLRARSFAPKTVAVIHIDGDLVDGTSRSVPLVGMKMTGAETVLKALNQANADPQVVALVLRIDSPGGSALAADLIAREVRRLGEHKPILCSFGDVAASGGYFLAAPCRRIFTNPLTVTGSIGIFGGKVDASGLLAKFGVHTTTLQRGAHADMEGNFRPYTDEERRLLLARLQAGYERFLATVSAGRNLRRDEVDALGQGHVWSGAAAIQKRLCDETGGLSDAVSAAWAAAGQGPGSIPVRYYPQEEPGLLRQLLALFNLPLSATPAALPAADKLRPWLIALPTALLLLESGVRARME
jgi:protease-4